MWQLTIQEGSIPAFARHDHDADTHATHSDMSASCSWHCNRFVNIEADILIQILWWKYAG